MYGRWFKDRSEVRGFTLTLTCCRSNISRCPCSEIPTTLNDAHEKLLHLMAHGPLAADLDMHLILEQACLRPLLDLSKQWLQLEKIRQPAATELARGNSIVTSTRQELDTVRAYMKQSACESGVTYIC